MPLHPESVRRSRASPSLTSHNNSDERLPRLKEGIPAQPSPPTPSPSPHPIPSHEISKRPPHSPDFSMHAIRHVRLHRWSSCIRLPATPSIPSISAYFFSKPQATSPPPTSGSCTPMLRACKKWRGLATLDRSWRQSVVWSASVLLATGIGNP